MKEIKAVIQPFMLDKVVCGLLTIGHFPGITISKVMGFGKGRGRDDDQAMDQDLIEYRQKIKLEILVADEMVEEVLQTIQKQAQTGKKGDGKIWVTDLLDIVKISTGKRGETAI